MPVGFKWFVAGPPRRLVLLRRRGERRRELPPPRRQRVDHRQGRPRSWTCSRPRSPRAPAAIRASTIASWPREFGAPCTRGSTRRRRRSRRRGSRSSSPAAVTAPLLAGEPITARAHARSGQRRRRSAASRWSAASGWFAARPSGTENIYKIYAESFRDERHLQAIVAEAREIVEAALAAPPARRDASDRAGKVCQSPRSHCILRELRFRRPVRCTQRTANRPLGRGDPMNATRQLHDLGQSLWLDNITRDLLTTGTLAALHRRAVGDRAHVESDDLRSGDQGQRRLRRVDPRAARGGQVRRSALLRAGAGRPDRARPTCSARSSSAPAASTAGCRSRSRRSSRTTRRRTLAAARELHARAGAAATSSSRSRARRKGCRRSRRRSSPACRST